MRIVATLLFAFLVIGFVGCGADTTPTAPEGTAIQDFLDANPDYVEEAGASQSEDEEMDAAGGGE